MFKASKSDLAFDSIEWILSIFMRACGKFLATNTSAEPVANWGVQDWLEVTIPVLILGWIIWLLFRRLPK